GWTVENLGTLASPTVTLPSGSTIPANGYFVISNFNSSDATSELLNSPSYVTTQVQLTNTGEQLTLRDSSAVTIDQTPVPAGSWAFGANGMNKRSMERNNAPSDG